MKLTLVDKNQVAPNTYAFTFESDTPTYWKTGQFLRIHIEDPNPDKRKNDRFFSISSAPQEGKIMITTKIDMEHGSSFKNHLIDLKIGESIEAPKEPMGDFVVENPNEKFVFIAGGIGITPFRAILKDFEFKNNMPEINLFYANKIPEVAFKEELEALSSKYPQFKIHYFIGGKKVDQTAIKEVAPDIKVPHFFVSGPEPMVEAIVEILRDLGVDDAHLTRDYFPGYDWP